MLTRKNLKQELLLCPICEKDFERISNNQKFCSPKCKRIYFYPSQNLSREQINKKISEARLKGLKKGNIKIWNKGLNKYNSESLKRSSEKNSQNMKEQYKNGLRKNWSQGLTKETSERVRIASKKSIDRRKENGFEEMSEKLSVARKKLYAEGKLKIWNKDATRDNNELVNSIAQKISGDKCYNWKGGKSFEPYPPLFTEHFKQTIRKRDNFTCQICYLEYRKDKDKRRFPIHHIDGNKMNTFPQNCVTLCKTCHDLIHSGYNKIWIGLIPNFQNKLHNLFGYNY